MLQRGDYAREICYFVVVGASPFPLQPVCIIYLLFPAHLLWPQLATCIFNLPRSQCCVQHVYVYIYVCM